jgi:dTDP-D-glucose 4,6-dehydratase
VIYLVKNYPEYQIINFDKLDYCSSLKSLACIEHAPNYKFVKGDILSEDLVSYVLSSNNIDTIMHFAAQTHVGKYHIDYKSKVFLR